MANTVSKNGRPTGAKAFAGRRIHNYRRPYGQWWFHPALRDGRFNRRDVPAMVQDNAVSIGLYTIYGPLFNAKFEVRANSKEIKQFIENTIHRFWSHDLMKILQHYVMTGTAIAEVMYERNRDSGLWQYAGLDDFDLNDVQALRRGRHLTGARVSYGASLLTGSPSSGGVHADEDPREWNLVRPPKLFWCAHRPLCGELFGHSVLEPSFGPWMEKCGAHGAVSCRRLWCFSNSFRGCLVKFPPGRTLNEDGSSVDNQDLAREMAEAYTTGAALTCPSGVDENNSPLWEIIDPAINGEVKGLMEYPDNLDRAIWQGMGVLDEVIHAPETGGSWSGRSGPLLVFLNISDMRVREIITAFDVGPSGYTTRNEQSGGVIRSLVMENFGPGARYEIIPISLVPNPAAPPGGGNGAPPKSPMGDGPAASGMGKPPQPAGPRPVQLSAAEVGVELPDDEVAAILAGRDDVQNIALSCSERIASAASDTDPNPTDAQKASGNYRKGHVTVQGLPITIETAKGSLRRGCGADGKPWSIKLKSHYGYIKKTESESDGDHIDVFLGPNPESEIVFIVDQNNREGKFDEHKCMIGWTNAEDAEDAYFANYSAGWNGFRCISALPMATFKEWIKNGDTSRPFDGQTITLSGSFDESRHPRGQPGNAGEFAKGGKAPPMSSIARQADEEKRERETDRLRNPADTKREDHAPLSPEERERIRAEGMPGHEHATVFGSQTPGATDPANTKPESAARRLANATTAAHRYVHDKAAAGFAKLPKPVQTAVSTALAVAFAGWNASQSMAERVSREKGATPEQAAQTRSTLAAWDCVAFKPVSMAAAPLGGVAAAATWVVPPVTAVYLAHAAVTSPLATYRAARGAVRDAIGKVERVVQDHTITLSSADVGRFEAAAAIVKRVHAEMIESGELPDSRAEE